MARQYIITIVTPEGKPESYNLEGFRKNRIIAGRAHQNDIVIDNAYVSRVHCSFYRDDNNWYITDENSRHGLLFRGEKIKSLQLNDGDKVCIENPENSFVIISFSIRESLPSGEDPQPVYGIQTYKLNKKNIMIGRSSECDIILSHPTVSRKHCLITFEKGHYYISDNHSTNGVILNSLPLENKQILKPSDRIIITSYTIIFDGKSLQVTEIIGGVSVTTRNLSKDVGKDKKKKRILDDITLTIKPNQFAAIIGGSGAGKTTLLNCISGMTDFSEGVVLINNESIRACGKSLRSLIGYVPQQDIVYDKLTVERMLYYSAKLRMPQDVNDKDIEKKINETLEMVELSAHRKTLISKLSGGERKRASIAVELLASPKLFFLDEPSSGLDPGIEKHLMQMLKRLADSGKTVIMITHTVQNIDLCDNVICMGRGGRLCFAGTPNEALAFFGKKSMTDVYDILNDHSKTAAIRYKENLPVQKSVTPASQAKAKVSLGKNFFGMWKDFLTMSARYTEILLNDRFRILLLLVMPIILTPLVCIAFQADGNFYNLLLRLNFPFVRLMYPYGVASHTFSLVLSFSCAAFWTGIFNSIQEISKERNIYERERFTGVGAVPYVFSKFIPLLILCCIQTFCMVIILRFMTNTTATLDGNINNTVHTAGLLKLQMSGSFGESFLTTFLCVLSAMCLGLAISSIASNEMALVLCPICLMPQILFSNVVSELSGFTLTLSNIISCKWSSLAFIISAKTNGTLYDSIKLSGGIWELGEEYTDVNRYTGTVSEAWQALTIICVVCVLTSIVILHYRKNQRR